MIADDERGGADERRETTDQLDACGRVIGFGHKAYKPDPRATYGFDPSIVRPLPVKKSERWR